MLFGYKVIYINLYFYCSQSNICSIKIIKFVPVGFGLPNTHCSWLNTGKIISCYILCTNFLSHESSGVSVFYEEFGFCWRRTRMADVKRNLHQLLCMCFSESRILESMLRCMESAVLLETAANLGGLRNVQQQMLPFSIGKKFHPICIFCKHI